MTESRSKYAKDKRGASTNLVSCHYLVVIQGLNKEVCPTVYYDPISSKTLYLR